MEHLKNGEPYNQNSKYKNCFKQCPKPVNCNAKFLRR